MPLEIPPIEVPPSPGGPATPPLFETEPAPNQESVAVSGEPLKVKMMYEIVVGIVIVLFIGFTAMFVATAAMLVDAWRSDKTAQEDLRNRIIEQSVKVDFLYKQMNDNRNINVNLR